MQHTMVAREALNVESRDGTQESRLADAVLADETIPPAVHQAQRCVAQQLETIEVDSKASNVNILKLQGKQP